VGRGHSEEAGGRGEEDPVASGLAMHACVFCHLYPTPGTAFAASLYVYTDAMWISLEFIDILSTRTICQGCEERPHRLHANEAGMIVSYSVRV
jgi:hypothetical protein